MATSFENSTDIDFPLEAVHAAYSEEEFWRRRVVAVGTERDTVDRFRSGPEGIEVTVTHHIPDSEIPAAARSVVKGSLTIVRTSHFGPLEGDTVVGSAHAEALGGIGVIDGDGECVATGPESCTETLRGSVRVSVPLVGGRLEKTVRSYLMDLFTSEYRFLEQYLSER